MPKAQKKPSKVIVYRPRRQSVVMAPSTLGWSALVTPDAKYDKDQPKFKINAHLTDAQFERNVEIIEAAVDGRKQGFIDECRKAGYDKDDFKWPDVRAWLTGKLKEAKKEGQGDFITLSMNHKKGVDEKTGREWETKPKAYDMNNNLLDLPSLRIGAGSVIQPIVDIGLFVSPKELDPLISIRLQGLRVAKLKQYTPGADLGAASEEDLALLGDEEDVDDLSDFIGSAFGGDDSSTTDEDEAPV